MIPTFTDGISSPVDTSDIVVVVVSAGPISATVVISGSEVVSLSKGNIVLVPGSFSVDTIVVVSKPDWTVANSDSVVIFTPLEIVVLVGASVISVLAVVVVVVSALISSTLGIPGLIVVMAISVEMPVVGHSVDVVVVSMPISTAGNPDSVVVSPSIGIIVVVVVVE